jgi:hypothetical protein
MRGLQRVFRSVSAVLAALAFLMSSAWAEQPTNSTPSPDPTYTFFLFGKVPGSSEAAAGDAGQLSVRLALEELLTKVRLKTRLRLTSNNRAMTEVMADRHACFGSLMKARIAAEGLKWIGPLGTTELVLAGRPGEIYGTIDLKAIKGSIGVLSGSLAARTAAAAGVKSDIVLLDQLNFDKLMAGRIDFWLTTRVTFDSATRSLSVKPPIVYESGPMEFGLGCNPEFPADVGNEIEQALSAFRTQHARDLRDFLK